MNTDNSNPAEDYQNVLTALKALEIEHSFTPAQVGFLRTRAAFQLAKPPEGLKELANFLEHIEDIDSSHIKAIRELSQHENLSSFAYCFCSSGNREWYVGGDNTWRCRHC